MNIMNYAMGIGKDSGLGILAQDYQELLVPPNPRTGHRQPGTFFNHLKQDPKICDLLWFCHGLPLNRLRFKKEAN